MDLYTKVLIKFSSFVGKPFKKFLNFYFENFCISRDHFHNLIIFTFPTQSSVPKSEELRLRRQVQDASKDTNNRAGEHFREIFFQEMIFDALRQDWIS